MKSNGSQLTLTEIPTLAWPLDEPARWPIGSGLAKRRLAAKVRRRALDAAERRAAALAERRAAAMVQTTGRDEQDALGYAHDGAMSRASGWFMPPPG